MIANPEERDIVTTESHWLINVRGIHPFKKYKNWIAKLV